MENIHPEEKRLLSYASDPAINVKYEEESSEKPYTQIKISKGVMSLTKEQRKTTKYKIHNSDTASRQVILEYPDEENWKLSDNTPKPEESSQSFHRFRVLVEPSKTAELTVEAVHPEESEYALTNLDSDEVALLVQQKRTTPAMQQAFDRILKQKNTVAGLDLLISQRRQESDQINADQNRIRENMKALKGTAEEKSLTQRYTRQLDSQEDRLSKLRAEIADLQKQRDSAQAELSLMIMDVNVDEHFQN
jgi:hypothetical protein